MCLVLIENHYWKTFLLALTFGHPTTQHTKQTLCLVHHQIGPYQEIKFPHIGALCVFLEEGLFSHLVP